MKCFLDANIIIDLLANRPPFTQQAESFVETAIMQGVDLETSSHAIATCYYILRKYISENELRKTLLNVMKFVDIIPMDKNILEMGLTSNFSDVEDAIQYFAAVKVSNEVIMITRDNKAFEKAKCLVLTPNEALSHLVNRT